jgi:hypothetical protein
MIYAFVLFFIASSILIYNLKKIIVSKNQVRSVTVKFLHEDKNYICAWISYSVVVFSLSCLARISYTENYFNDAFVVAIFIAILLLSKDYFLSPDGLRQLK